MACKVSSSLVALALTLFAAPALAQDPAASAKEGRDPAPASERADNGVSVGLRTGLPFGAGSMVKGVLASDTAKFGVPLWVDVGYRFSHFYAGAYGEYVYMAPKTGPGACPEGASCSAHALDFGINLQYHVRPGRSVDPWFGVGVGYEIGVLSGAAGPMTFSGSMSGYEFFNLQGGADFELGHTLAMGPFVTAGLGQFSKMSSTQGSTETSASIPDDQRTLHVTGVLGVRGSFTVLSVR